MKVVHFSDWHTEQRHLPEADLYICTGDMLPNKPFLVYEWPGMFKDPLVWDPYGRKHRPKEPYQLTGRALIPEKEAEQQTKWMLTQDYRAGAESPQAQVACVRGNHDFTDLAPLFRNGPVWEVTEDPLNTLTFQGLKIGGWRGVGYMQGEWSDEKRELQMHEEIRRLPDDLDILITHDPPFLTMDFAGDHAGSQALAGWLLSHPNVKLHCFGHIHERHGILKPETGTISSNAATTINVIEI
ncbi:MAG: metallophosphoesterase family protein [Acidiferrobacterales bacterium]